MKQLLQKLKASIFFAITILGLISFVQIPQIAMADTTKPNADDYLRGFQYTVGEGKEAKPLTGSKLAAVQALPQTSWAVSIAAIIKIILNITGAITLGILTYGGYLMATARGDTKMVDKGKSTLTFAIIGLVVIAASYAIVLGVSELQVFNPGTGVVQTGPSGQAAVPASGNKTEGGNPSTAPQTES